MKDQQSPSHLSRRSFIASAAGATVAVSAVSSKSKATEPPKKFKLKYAPALDLFRQHAGTDPIDHIKFMADEGFSAVFDNGLMSKAPDLQEKIGKELNTRGMILGPFVLYADFAVKSFVNTDDDTRKMLADKMRQGVETAKRAGAKWALVVPGRYDEKLEWDYQTAHVIENLRRCVEVVEPSGLILVLEPLNRHNHPGLFLTGIPQAYEICRAVNRP
jgi:hydroxypyruvate isomerase